MYYLDEYTVSHVHVQAENNHQVSVKVPLDFVPYLIGREGATIRKIREETDTRINMPMHSDSSASSADAVTVVGKRKNVEDARSRIEALLKQFVRHSLLCAHMLKVLYILREHIVFTMQTEFLLLN